MLENQFLELIMVGSLVIVALVASLSCFVFTAEMVVDGWLRYRRYAQAKQKAEKASRLSH
ncbi:MAG: hypothetical protein IGS03_00535 [Candidatus Sericytochromatia bacterium]|nr:hypothetical protein [Candidatus Sericytochromatia bacterium]